MAYCAVMVGGEMSKESAHLKKLVDRGVSYVLVDRHDATGAARLLLDDVWVSLSEDDKRLLAERGLARTLSEHVADARRGVGRGADLTAKKEKEERRRTTASVIAKGEARLREKIQHTVHTALRTITLKCDGVQKPLFKFTQRDLAVWQSLTKQHAAIWSLREKWFTKARDEMAKVRADCVGDLPMAVLTVLNSLAASAWGDVDVNN